MTNRQRLQQYLAQLIIEYGERDYSIYANWREVEEADKAFMAKVSNAIKTNGRIWEEKPNVHH